MKSKKSYSFAAFTLHHSRLSKAYQGLVRLPRPKGLFTLKKQQTMNKTIKNMMAKGVAIVLVALCALATACSSDDDPVKRDPDVADIDYVVAYAW